MRIGWLTYPLCGSGYGPACGFVVQAQGGQAGEVQDACSGQDVGQDAFASAASGFTGTPGAAGEVADLAFHDRTVLPVVLLPGRVFLAGLGVLQVGFMGVEADHPSPSGFRAGRPQWAGRAELAETGCAVAASADEHAVIGWAGDGAGGQVDRELVFGLAVRVAHRGHFGAHVARAACSFRVAPSA